MCKSWAVQQIKGALPGQKTPCAPPRRQRLTKSCSEPPVLPSPRILAAVKSRPEKQTGEGVAFVAVIFVLFVAVWQAQAHTRLAARRRAPTGN